MGLGMCPSQFTNTPTDPFNHDLDYVGLHIDLIFHIYLCALSATIAPHIKVRNKYLLHE